MSQIKKQLSRQAGTIEAAWARPLGITPIMSGIQILRRKARLELVQLNPADKMRLEAARGLDLDGSEAIYGIKWRNYKGLLPALHEYNQAINTLKLTGSLIHQRIAIIAN